MRKEGWHARANPDGGTLIGPAEAFFGACEGFGLLGPSEIIKWEPFRD